MNRNLYCGIICACLLAGCILISGCTGGSTTVTDGASPTVTITDAMGRSVEVPAEIDSVVCSGSGCLRYLTYLGAEDLIVGVDDIEHRVEPMDARPYFMANPQFRDYPLIGEYRGLDDPEKILALQPDVIFKTYPEMGYNPVELQEKTGIPVVTLNYGDIGLHRDDFYTSLRTMGAVLGRDERADEVIAFFDAAIADLDNRTSDAADGTTAVYVGGIAYKGAHGLQSTEAAYPPFLFINTENVAYDASKGVDGQITGATPVAKEKILEWDPDVVFIDLATLQLTDGSNAIDELKNDPAYAGLSVRESGEVYGVLPYSWYSQNQGSILADAYFIGKTLYPDRFSDVDPAVKADEIYSFLVEEPVFSEMNSEFGGMAFTRLSLQ
ncbi:iron ABC transporter substrate-binding protein [Methanofollis fontis]|uniref:Iron ABC transporter substrate-binding protein n=1 Tax=Methanofollis fontis TaxID=2052832 RepID=A0A483CWI4_9EURY|nr:iron ABC transporter substrate-binding protein [Methanofollis fontis]TAJ44016.1 iron ABC transporter substrate-binding protein [Methanofollis fontis]